MNERSEGTKVDSTDLLAFSVTTDCAEASVLVWETTPGKAKASALCSLWLDGCDWNDLRCKREPRADGYRTTPGTLGDDCTPDDCRLMRHLGWHEIDGPEEPCSVCGKYEWRMVPESRLSQDGDVCAECQAKATLNAACRCTVDGLVLKLAAWLDAKGCRCVRHHSCQHVTIQEHRRNGWTTLACGKTVREACERMDERGEFDNDKRDGRL